MRNLIESMGIAALQQIPPGCPIARAAREARDDIELLAATEPEAAARYRRKLREAIALRDESRIASVGMNAIHALNTRRTPGC